MTRVNGFDYDPGFEYDWDAMPAPQDRRYAIYSFRDADVEVGRALVALQPLRVVGYLVPADQITTELDYFEVRKGHRARGVGRQVVKALVTEHGRLYALSSPDGVGFYRGIGWKEYPHENGPSPAQAELLVGG